MKVGNFSSSKPTVKNVIWTFPVNCWKFIFWHFEDNCSNSWKLQVGVVWANVTTHETKKIEILTKFSGVVSKISANKTFSNQLYTSWVFSHILFLLHPHFLKSCVTFGFNHENSERFKPAPLTLIAWTPKNVTVSNSRKYDFRSLLFKSLKS